MEKIRLGKIHVDYYTSASAIEDVKKLVDEKKGGYVVTPNIDHIVVSEKDSRLEEAYASASISIADGKPLIWMSKLLGRPLPEKISGSDFVFPLMQLAAEQKYSVYMLGGRPGVGAKAAEVLKKRYPGLNVVGTDSPPLGFEKNEVLEQNALSKIKEKSPDIVLMALGAPKQEILMYKWYNLGVVSIMFGIGASLDFIAGNTKRAPRWMSDIGLEWFYRIIQDPVRMFKRYFIRDRAIIGIFYKTLKMKKGNNNVSE